jgi:hypothetical protein
MIDIIAAERSVILQKALTAHGERPKKPRTQSDQMYIPPSPTSPRLCFASAPTPFPPPPVSSHLSAVSCSPTARNSAWRAAFIASAVQRWSALLRPDKFDGASVAGGNDGMFGDGRRRSVVGVPEPEDAGRAAMDMNEAAADWRRFGGENGLMAELCRVRHV